MDFVYPQDFAGAKSGNFKFVPRVGTIAIRRNFSRINSEVFRNSKNIEAVSDMALRIETSADDNCRYLVECVRCICDISKMTADETDLLFTEWDGDFWGQQPIEEAEQIIQLFRQRNSV